MQHDALLLAQLYMFHPSGSSRAHAHACSRGWTQGGDEGQLVARAQPRAALARGRCSAPGLVTSLHIPFGAGGVLYVAFAGLGLVSQSIMVYALLAEHEFNVLGAVLFHLVISLTSDLSVSLVLGLSLTFMMAYGLIAALVTSVVVIVRRELPFARLAPRGLAVQFVSAVYWFAARISKASSRTGSRSDPSALLLTSTSTSGGIPTSS